MSWVVAMMLGFAGAAGAGLVFGWMAGRLAAHRTSRAAAAISLTAVAAVALPSVFLGPIHAAVTGTSGALIYLVHDSWRRDRIRLRGETM